MSLRLWLVLSVPVIAGFLVLFGWVQGKRLRLIAKGGATWMVFSTALIGQCMMGIQSGSLIVAAMAVFVLADVLLDVKLLPGIAAFAVGHVLLISWLLAQGIFSFASIPIGAALYVLMLLLFNKHITKLGNRTVPFLLYPIVLAAMTAMAIMLPVLGGRSYVFFAVGAALFAASDMVVAANIIIGMPKSVNAIGLCVYYAAIELMALSCWQMA